MSQTRYLLLWVGVFAFFLATWVSPIYAPDDYLFATRSGLPNRQTDLASLFHFLKVDLFERNGRISDVITQLAMTSDLFVALTAATVSSLLTFSLFLWIRRLSAIDFIGFRQNAMIVCIAVSVPFIVTWADPNQAGDTLYFFSATVSTVGGVAGALLTAYILECLFQEPKRSILWAGAIVGMVVASLVHESAGLFIVGFVTASLVRRSPVKTRLAVFFAILTVFAARMAVPGIWRRAGLVEEAVYKQKEYSGLSIVLIRISRATFEQISFNADIWFLLSVTLCALAIGVMRKSSSSPDYLTLTATGFVVVSYLGWYVSGLRLGVWWRGSAQTPDDYARIFISKTGMIGILAIVVWHIGALMILLFLQKNDSDRVVLPIFVAGAATLMIPTYIGTGQGRQVFFFAIGATLVVVSIALRTIIKIVQSNDVAGTLRDWNSKAKLVLVLPTAGVALVVATFWVPGEYVRLWENQRIYSAVHQEVLAAKRGESHAVRIPDQVPFRSLSFRGLHYRSEFREQFRLFHGLGSHVDVLVNME